MSFSPPRKAALYARFSTEHQCSIEIQFAKMQEFCLAQGFSVSPMHAYSDEALSGMRTARRFGFQDLMVAAERHEFDVVVLYDLTRGSREVVDWFTFRRKMQSLGIQVLSMHDRLGNLDDPADFLPELISVGMGQVHVLTSRLKSMDKVDYLAQQGKFLGGYAPLGYEIKDGEYFICEREAAYVRTIYAMYADGKSYNEILAALPSALRGKRGRPIGKNSLYTILRNDRYIGRYSWCKRQVKYFSEWAGGGQSDRAVIIEDAIPAIIDKATWERVQTRMQENRINKTNHSSAHREYLLSGVLFCGSCGASFFGATTINKKGSEYKFYKCGNKNRTGTCHSKNISANDIEPLIVNLLRNALLNGSLIEKTADAILSVGAGNSSSDLKTLNTQLAQLDLKISNLVDAISNGLSSDAVREKLGLLESERAALKLKQDSLKPCHETLDRDFIISELQRDCEILQNSPSAMKQLIKKYIPHIDVFDDHIEIHCVADLAATSGIPLKTKKDGVSNISAENTITNGCGSQI